MSPSQTLRACCPAKDPRPPGAGFAGPAGNHGRRFFPLGRCLPWRMGLGVGLNWSGLVPRAGSGLVGRSYAILLPLRLLGRRGRGIRHRFRRGCGPGRGGVDARVRSSDLSAARSLVRHGPKTGNNYRQDREGRRARRPGGAKPDGVRAAGDCLASILVDVA